MVTQSNFPSKPSGKRSQLINLRAREGSQVNGRGKGGNLVKREPSIMPSWQSQFMEGEEHGQHHRCNRIMSLQWQGTEVSSEAREISQNNDKGGQSAHRKGMEPS